MMLIVDLCYEKDSLSKYEFVDPIEQAVRATSRRYRIRHFTELDGREIDVADGVILCGTAIKDNSYAERIEEFSWIRAFERPILGICAGMQVMATVFGGKIVPWPEIGLREIQIVSETPLLGKPRQITGYHLHNYGVTLPRDFGLVAGFTGQVQAFKHRELPAYGIIFHPEVRNKWIIERFCNLE
jgi:GMP synthase-like glutamine amidotransferase